MFTNLGPRDEEPLLTKISPSLPDVVAVVDPISRWNKTPPTVPPAILLAVEIVPIIPRGKMFPPTYKSPPMPTPPLTCRAPVVVDTAEVVLDVRIMSSVVTSVVVTVVHSMVNVCAIISPPTYKLPPMPTPPATTSAPVCVDVAVVVPASVNVLL